MVENIFDNISYAKWLEESLQVMFKQPVKGICIYATLENDDIYNAYYNVSMGDKLLIAGLIQQDAMYDTLVANGIIEDNYDEEEEACDGEEEG